MKHSKYELVFIVFSAFSAVSAAQTIPDAGALMRQNEQMLRQEQLQRNAQRRQSYPPVMVFNETVQVTPQRIKFLGAKLISNEQLQTVAQPYLNRPLNQHELEHLTDAVAQTYRRAGRLVRVYIPQQDLSQVDLNVQILENMPSSAP